MFGEEIWNEMFAHAKADYPAECCGIITNVQGNLTVHRCENIQDKLHAADPQTHPRTSKLAYRMDDMQVMRIQREAESKEGQMVAIYHSHIDVDAYFSEEDQNAAMFFGEPAYPGVVYPVIPVKDGRVDEAGRKVFQWCDQTSTFEQIP
ncbi:MAG: Mov34/MPN/PAD-1 family protein [Candidatus Latescibacterota bacterium]|jgi:proteasome lid subunit RPN8/RPN11